VDDGPVFTFQQLLSFARRRFWIVVVVAALGGALGLGVSLASPAVYAASSELVVTRQSTSQTGTAVDPVRYAQTQIELIKSGPVRKEVDGRLGSQAKDVGTVSAAAVGGSDVIRVTVESSKPKVAKKAADTYADAYVAIRDDRAQRLMNAASGDLAKRVLDTQKQLATLDTRIAALQNTTPRDTTEIERQTVQRDLVATQYDALSVKYQATLLDVALAKGDVETAARAALPTQPVRPKIAQNVVLGIVLGLLAGFTLALLTEYLADRITSREDLERVRPEVSVLGEIPLAKASSTRRGARVVSIENPATPLAEAYRALRMSVQVAAGNEPLSLLVTSTAAAEGTTTTVVNLGTTMARAGKRVMLVDLDFRNPAFVDVLDLPGSVGVTSVLLGDTQLSDAFRKVPVNGGVPMLVMPSGPVPSNPGQLVEGGGLIDLMESLRKSADIVIVDAPPVLEVADALVLSPLVDGVILVAGAGVTRRRDLKRAASLIRQSQGSLLGVVVNYAPTRTWSRGLRDSHPADREGPRPRSTAEQKIKASRARA
jgi:capsular exopolysaccharide synthesis family protein